MKTAMVDLAAFSKLLNNPKDHDAQAIARSVKRFGYLEPVVVNETTGHVLAGHGRIEALQGMKAMGKDAPKGIVAEGEKWLVPTFYADVDEKDEYAAAIALNKIVELGGWREDVLVGILANYAARDESALLATGYDKADVDMLLAMQASYQSESQDDNKGVGETEDKGGIMDSVTFSFGALKASLSYELYERFAKAVMVSGSVETSLANWLK